MLALYIIFTICAVQNMKKCFADGMSSINENCKLFVIFVISQIINQNQR